MASVSHSIFDLLIYGNYSYYNPDKSAGAGAYLWILFVILGVVVMIFQKKFFTGKTPLSSGPAASFCPNCGIQVKQGDSFCPNCGARAISGSAALCPHCGTPAKPGDAFCANCGSSLPVRAGGSTDKFPMVISIVYAAFLFIGFFIPLWYYGSLGLEKEFTSLALFLAACVESGSPALTAFSIIFFGALIYQLVLSILMCVRAGTHSYKAKSTAMATSTLGILTALGAIVLLLTLNSYNELSDFISLGLSVMPFLQLIFSAVIRFVLIDKFSS